MPQTRITEKTVFTFDELDDSAKDRARDWFRAGDTDFDTEYVFEDVAEIGALMGIDLRQRVVKLMGGGIRMEPAIFYSGFSSQGDGACFESTYAYKSGSVVAVRKHVGADQPDASDSGRRVVAIAQALADAQKPAFYALQATTKHSGHYYHSGCMEIDVFTKDSGYDEPPQADAIRDALRAFADWIYRALEAEYEYRNANEQVDESIRANEYEFDETGRIA